MSAKCAPLEKAWYPVFLLLAIPGSAIFADIWSFDRLSAQVSPAIGRDRLSKILCFHSYYYLHILRLKPLLSKILAAVHCYLQLIIPFVDHRHVNLELTIRHMSSYLPAKDSRIEAMAWPIRVFNRLMRMGKRPHIEPLSTLTLSPTETRLLSSQSLSTSLSVPCTKIDLAVSGTEIAVVARILPPETICLALLPTELLLLISSFSLAVGTFV